MLYASGVVSRMHSELTGILVLESFFLLRSYTPSLKVAVYAPSMCLWFLSHECKSIYTVVLNHYNSGLKFSCKYLCVQHFSFFLALQTRVNVFSLYIKIFSSPWNSAAQLNCIHDQVYCTSDQCNSQSKISILTHSFFYIVNFS